MLEDGENLLGERVGRHEIAVGTFQPEPVDGPLLRLLGRQVGGLLAEVIVEALQDVQPVDLDDLFRSGSSMKPKRAVSRKMPGARVST